MKKRLLVLLIAASSMLMPNLASAIHIDLGGPIACEFQDGQFICIPVR
jgi:hypothetical protein